VSWGDWWNGNYKDRQLIPVKVRIGYDLLRTVFKAFTPAYVSRLGDFPQSLIVNTACAGLDNDTLKDAFLGKGAAAYLGYKGAGIYNFSQGLLKTLFTVLTETKKNVGDAYAALGGTTAPTIPGIGKGGGVFSVSPEGRDYVYSGSFKNGDFETGDLTSWVAGGDGRVLTAFGGYRSRAPGGYLGLISTGLGFTTQQGGIRQEFCLSKDATEVQFDWSFSSEEFVEYCNRQFQDTFKVELVDELDQVTTLFTRTIDDLCGAGVTVGLAPPLDVSKPGCIPTNGVGIGTGGNDCKVYTTGWQSASIDVSSAAAANDGKGVTLKFSVSDVGDSAYDSAVTLDNIKIVTP